jgi:hypothetical protein
MNLHRTHSLSGLFSIAIAAAALVVSAPALADHHGGHGGHGGGPGGGHGSAAHYERHDRHAWAHPVVVRHPVGHVVTVLPPEHHLVHVHHVDYYYRSGVFYRSAPGGYVIVAAPVGAFVAALPIGYTSLYIRGRPYYLYNDTYYAWDAAQSGYVVVERPYGATESAPVAVYPREDRDPDQQARDRYECHSYAVSQSGFDPSRGVAGSTEQQIAYDRSIRGCLESRNYASEQ